MNHKVVRQYKFKVIGGKMVIEEIGRFNQALSKMEGQQGYLALLPEDADPLPSHRGYYFGIMIPQVLTTEEFGGWTKPMVHDYVKDSLKVSKTRGMSKKEFTEFVERAKDLFASHDIFFEDESKHYQYGKRQFDLPDL
jgi:hypothetical protein